MTTSSQRAAILYTTRRVSTGQITADTGRGERYALARFADAMGNRSVGQIGRSDIERWQATIRHLAPGTKRRHFGIIRAFFDDLVDRGTINRSPVRPMPAPKVPRSPSRALTHEQVAKLYAAAGDELGRCLISLHFQMALRAAEAAGVELGDVNWSPPEMYVTGKGGHSRWVPIPLEAQEAINDYLLVRGGGGGPLLRQRRHPAEGVTPAWVSEEVSRIAYAAGVKQRPRDGVGSHSGRHTAATDILRRTKDPKAVQRVLGHQSLATTDRYCAGMDNEALAVAMEGRTYRSVA